MDSETDRKLMEYAVELSRKSVHEKDARIHPFVGAVIAHPDGEIINTSYRGKRTPGNHAEQEALIDIDPAVLRGSVVYSTLEPCTFRNNQTPCCMRLINAGVAEVVIGILDPNKDIRGQGWWQFEERNIKVRNFDPDLVQEIRTINREFIEHQRGIGLMITAIQVVGGDALDVTPDHRLGREILSIAANGIAIRGTYRVKPSTGESIRLFVVRNGFYYPKKPIDFNFDRDRSLWQAPYAWINTGEPAARNEIIVARLSEDLTTAFNYYDRVHSVLMNDHKIDRWIGWQLRPEPPGFERLVSLQITGVKGSK
jgi:pyrimidine deaminase RibD-like protein